MSHLHIGGDSVEVIQRSLISRCWWRGGSRLSHVCFSVHRERHRHLRQGGRRQENVVGHSHRLKQESGHVATPLGPKHEKRQRVTDQTEDAQAAEHEHVQDKREPVAIGSG